MAICILSNAKFVVRRKRRINCYFLSGIFFVSMLVVKRLKKTLGLMWRKGIGIIQRIISMPRIINCFLQSWICCYPSYKWWSWKKGSESCVNCYYFALVATRTSRVRIWGNEAFVLVHASAKKHWSDNSNWTMAKFMHQKVLRATMVAMGAACYVVFSFDEISIVDNQF